jgi:HSP20 family protein
MQFFSPRADVTESDKEMMITLELPGIDKNQVDLEVDDGRLVITGKKETKLDKKEEGVVRRERFFGTFRREFAVPGSVDPANVRAKFDNGVLEVTLPKTKPVEKPGRHIEIR